MDESQSTLDPELINAYKSTLFQIFLGDTFVTLKIGETCEPLQNLFQKHAVASACFITSYNPFGRLLSIQENQTRNDKLETELRAKYPILEGIGVDPKGEWEGERSFLVLGINLTEAEELAELHQQNAVVFVGTNFVPALVFTR